MLTRRANLIFFPIYIIPKTLGNMARTGYGIVGLLVPHSQDSTLLMMNREGPHSKLIYSGWTYIHLSVGGWMAEVELCGCV